MILIAYSILLIVQLLFAVFILFLCLSFVTGGPFVPSSNTSVAAMIGAAKIKRGMTVYDIGSGDGRVLFAAARKGANAVGIEINPFLVLYVRILALFSPYRRSIRVIWGNLWTTDVSPADVVFVYLIPWKMRQLADKLEKELKPSARVVSNSFMFPKWRAVAKNSDLHVYTYAISR